MFVLCLLGDLVTILFLYHRGICRLVKFDAIAFYLNIYEYFELIIV